MKKYVVTGNDYLSLPQINENTAAVENVTFLYMKVKGMYLLTGKNAPFFRPIVRFNGAETPLKNLTWTKTEYWIPSFVAETEKRTLRGTYLTPDGDRGFMLRLEFESGESGEAEIGYDGEWAKTVHETNNSFEAEGVKKQWFGWYDAPVFGYIEGIPQFVYSFLMDKNVMSQVSEKDGVFSYRCLYKEKTQKNGKMRLDIAFGLGFEAVAAVTSALEMLRQTFDSRLEDTAAFLRGRSVRTGDEKADLMLNYNLFFCYFFAAGRTLDTEELVMVTSRSPRYYVSAAYWDRDGLLWAFPAILKADQARAKEMLDYVFTRQIRNAGVHSRYIDGTVLEPGFELDELCAPAIALCRYVEETGDTAYLSREYIVDGINHILAVLKTKKHEKTHLYETFLYPSDDMHEYRYLTYDNALTANMLRSLAKTYSGIWTKERVDLLKEEAESICNSIFEHCVTEQKGKKIFAWCVDLKGHQSVYDEPPGSLVLLPYLGFCNKENEIYKNTLERLYAADYQYSFAGKKFSEIGCAHNPHPWVLSYCNSVLADRGSKEAVMEMLALKMDHGIACESISEDTGETTSGEAFATCAGMYAYALMTHFDRKKQLGGS